MENKEFKVLVRKDTGEYCWIDRDEQTGERNIVAGFPELMYNHADMYAVDETVSCSIEGFELKDVVLLSKDKYDEMESQLRIYRTEEMLREAQESLKEAEENYAWAPGSSRGRGAWVKSKERVQELENELKQLKGE